MDEFCEMLNDYLKKISSSENLKSLVGKSLFISLMRRCKNIIGPYNVIKHMNHGTNRKPSRISDKNAIKELFRSILPFTSMNRSIEDNWLWACYNSCKLPVKSNTTGELTTHKKK